MARIPRWAYIEDGFGEGWVAWLRGFQRLVVVLGGLFVLFRLVGPWGLFGIPLLVLLSLLIDGLILHVWPQDDAAAD